jgi:glycosyltransferase 2 family protein
MRTERGSSRRRAARWLGLFGGLAVIAFLMWRMGSGPFLHGLDTVDGWPLAAAVGIGAITTASAAWRWKLVARALGVEPGFGSAFAAYYRAQFLNAALPGGFFGDVHRGVRHGRDVGDMGKALRAVWWERTAGQAVQVTMAVAILLAFPSPVRHMLPPVAIGLIGAVVGTALLARIVPRLGRPRWVSAVGAVWSDVRHCVLARRRLPGILVGSAVVVIGHLATFILAAHAVGAGAPLIRLLPLTLLALLAMALPFNVGGWGPREGVAAVAFGAGGLTAAQGVATAVAYGVLVLAASLPGAAVLASHWFGDMARRRRPPTPATTEVRVKVAVDG